MANPLINSGDAVLVVYKRTQKCTKLFINHYLAHFLSLNII